MSRYENFSEEELQIIARADQLEEEPYDRVLIDERYLGYECNGCQQLSQKIASISHQSWCKFSTTLLDSYESPATINQVLPVTSETDYNMFESPEPIETGMTGNAGNSTSLPYIPHPVAPPVNAKDSVEPSEKPSTDVRGKGPIDKTLEPKINLKKFDIPGNVSPGTENDTEWAKKFLEGFVPKNKITEGDIAAVLAWMGGEGTEAKNNPLATTQGSGNDFNSVGVQNYDTWEEGLKNTIDTVKLPYYKELRRNFKKYDNPFKILKTKDLNTWGTGKLPIQVLKGWR